MNGYCACALTCQELGRTPLSFKYALNWRSNCLLQELFLQGTTFVLQKDVDPRQRLLRAIAVKNNVEKVNLAPETNSQMNFATSSINHSL